MSVRRIVNTSFWESAKVIDKFSVEDKYFMLYLLTNPMTTQLGIYKLPLRIIAFQTGYTVESVIVILDRFENKYKNIIYYKDTQEIAILNSLKYSIIKGGKPVSDLLIKEIGAVDSTVLIKSVYSNMYDWWGLSNRAFDKTIKDIFENELDKRKVPKENNDNDNDNDNEESYHESLVESLNDREIMFNEFWELYPRKINKKKSRTAYERISKVNHDLIIEDLTERVQTEEWLKDNGKFIPHPTTYLNGERWFDEMGTKPQFKPKGVLNNEVTGDPDIFT